MFGANLVILAQSHDELSRGQVEIPRILSQNGHNDLEDQGQWPPFPIPAKSFPWCMFGENLVIPAQICNGQCKVYGRTDRRTGGQTQATTIPLRLERSRGKNKYNLGVAISHICYLIDILECWIYSSLGVRTESNESITQKVCWSLDCHPAHIKSFLGHLDRHPKTTRRKSKYYVETVVERCFSNYFWMDI